MCRTFGSWQAATGANSYIIGKSLGHYSQQSTAVYARLNLDPVRDSVNKAPEAMFGDAKTLRMKEVQVPDIDFVSKYREALACYSEADFEKIFTLGGIEGKEQQDLGKDFLGQCRKLFWVSSGSALEQCLVLRRS